MTNSGAHKVLLTRILLAAGFIGVTAFFAMWAWTDMLTDLGGDSAGYLIMSRLYSPYHTPSIATLGFKSQIVFPPLFPWILALVDGGYHLLIAHLVVAAFASASVLALYLWLRAEGLSVSSSALTALIFAILPATAATLFNIWSEFPYVFFSVATMAAMARAESSPPGSSRLRYVAAGLVACATLTRVAALPLLGAFLIYLALKRPRRWVITAALTALPFLAWALYSHHSERGAGAYVSHVVNAYSGDIFDKLSVQFQSEYHAIFAAWNTGWIGFSHPSTLQYIVHGFWFICIVGWLYRLKSLKLDAIYTLLYVALLFLWPYPGEASRYSMVLYPIFIANGIQLFTKLATYLPGKSNQLSVINLAAGVLLICAVPATALNVKRFQEDVPEDISYARHTTEWYEDSPEYAKNGNAHFTTRLFRDLQKMGTLVPQNDCVFAIKPSVVILYADRLSYGPPTSAESDANFDLEIKKCRFAYALALSSPSYGKMFYPLERLGGRAQIVSKLLDETGDPDGELIEIKNQDHAPLTGTDGK